MPPLELDDHVATQLFRQVSPVLYGTEKCESGDADVSAETACSCMSCVDLLDIVATVLPSLCREVDRKRIICHRAYAHTRAPIIALAI